MTDLLELMAVPFAACVVLVGIHAYLGLHVIQRKVIFVDLALAQIAALGATFSFLLGMSPHGRGAYFFALGFAIVGAGVFSVTRMRHERIPQEAIIGVIYAVALACAILVADRAPEGAEHIKETLVGAVLWVSWPTVVKTAVIYALVGALHVALRKRFFQISFQPAQAYAEGRWVRFWDFIFYVTFAFVITSSVTIAGVLLVFTFLVIPAMIATLFAERISSRLAIGWSVGIVACLVGMVASYRFDTPSGPTVVASMGMALILAALLYYVRVAPRKTSAALRVLAGLGITVGILAGLGIFLTSGTYLHIAHEHDWEREHASDEEPVAGGEDFWSRANRECDGNPDCVGARISGRLDRNGLLAAALQADDAAVREMAAEVAGGLDDPESLEILAGAAAVEPDPLLRLRYASLLWNRRDARGLTLAVDLLATKEPPLIREEALLFLVGSSGSDFGYDAFGGEEANTAAVARWRTWVAERRALAGTSR